MRVINFLSNPDLWQRNDLLLPLAGQLIHGEPVGTRAKEIFAAIESHFKISRHVILPAGNNIEADIAEAELLVSKYFDLRTVNVFVAGIDDSEEFVNTNLGGVSGYAWPNSVIIFLNPKREFRLLLGQTLIHELNHCERYKHCDPYKAFLDWLVFEGLAQSFENEIYGDSNSRRDRSDRCEIHPHAEAVLAYATAGCERMVLWKRKKADSICAGLHGRPESGSEVPEKASGDHLGAIKGAAIRRVHLMISLSNLQVELDLLVLNKWCLHRATCNGRSFYLDGADRFKK